MQSRSISVVIVGILLWVWTPQSWAQNKDPNCSAANLMLVVDVSGSMSEGGKLEGLKKAILDTVDKFKTTLRLGLISFSGTQANLLVQVGPDNMKDANAVAAHVDKLQKAVQGLKALGTTPMTAAMKLALDNYIQIIPNDELHKDPDPKTQRRCFVLLATDGEPTDGNPLPHIKSLRSLKVGTKTYDIRTFVVGLGSDQLIRTFQLQQFAIQGGTENFLHALTPDDLKPFFEKISNSASKEVCDGRDNDCDGVIDEDLKRDCKDKCGTGQQICQKGVWSACSAPQPKAEECNGRDDNCNGQVDEGLTRACRTSCGEGSQSCIQGDWSTCDAPSPEAEICDGLDNDCDGQIDNGTLCPGGKCVPKGAGKAACEIKCKGGECPAGYTCDRNSNLCVPGPCANKKCKPGEICSDKTGQAVCEDLCANVQCPAGKTCGNSGTCIDCYKEDCPPQMICLEGRCTLDQCALTGCDRSQACVLENGKAVCKNTCVNVKCAQGEYCQEGQCKVDPCLKIPCDADQVCDRSTSRCVKNQCLQSKVSCGSSGALICDPLSGACVDNKCSSIKCPTGSYCHLGECWESTKPKALPPGQCNEAKDCGAPGMICQNGYCAKQGGGDTGKGCGCHSQPTTQWPSMLLIGLWLMLLWVRRLQVR